ncbi:MAG: SCP2 sterol-binding domain-containing protein [Chloroflexi bacterium]|nr:SCP2 sterol-binding domain-containing protein [Chloroflexota bacterium]
MPDKTVREWIDELPSAFDPSKSAGIDAVIQLNLSGDQAGDWYITIREQCLQVIEGNSPAPNLTVKGDAGDVLQILTGKMDAMRAFMQGKLKISGDIALAMKLTSLFKSPD